MEAVTDFLFLGSKITVDGDCSHETRRQFLLGRKAMTNLDSVLKAKVSLCQQCLYSQGYGLSSSRIQMTLTEQDKKEGKVPKNMDVWNCGAGEDS